MAARVSIILVVLTSAVAAAPACRARESDAFAGDWVMRLDDRPLMILKLERDGDTYTGALRRPKTMSTDGFAFSNLGGGPVSVPVVSAARDGDTLRLVIADDDDPADKTTFAMAKSSADEATLRFVDAPFGPWRRSIRQPQIFGTQFGPGGAGDQGPYDSGLIPDLLRRDLHVRPLSEQQEHYRKFVHPDPR